MTASVVSQRARTPGAEGGSEALASGDQSAWQDSQPPEPEPRVWAAHEVAELVSRYPRLSPLRVLGAQVAAGMLVALATALLTQRVGGAASALYGAAVVVVPAALLAYGVRSPAPSAAVAQVRFLMWAFVKLGVAAAMLAAAGRVVPDLSWPGLLVAMVVCLKVYAWALLWQRRVKKNA